MIVESKFHRPRYEVTKTTYIPLDLKKFIVDVAIPAHYIGRLLSHLIPPHTDMKVATFS